MVWLWKTGANHLQDYHFLELQDTASFNLPEVSIQTMREKERYPRGYRHLGRHR